MKKKTDIIAPKVHENIEPMDFSDLLSDKFMPYTYAVIEDRALPDARDGLKPSQRRILVTMDDLNLKSSGQTEKSAKTVIFSNFFSSVQNYFYWVGWSSHVVFVHASLCL